MDLGYLSADYFPLLSPFIFPFSTPDSSFGHAISPSTPLFLAVSSLCGIFLRTDDHSTTQTSVWSSSSSCRLLVSLLSNSCLAGQSTLSQSFSTESSAFTQFPPSAALRKMLPCVPAWPVPELRHFCAPDGSPFHSSLSHACVFSLDLLV